MGNVSHGDLMGLPLGSLLRVEFSKDRRVKDNGRVAVENSTVQTIRNIFGYMSQWVKTGRIENSLAPSLQKRAFGRIHEFTEIADCRQLLLL